MTLACNIASCLYALLMAFAALAQARQGKKPDLLMLLGAALVAAANLLARPAALAAATAGLLVIHAAALLNGKRNGKVNPLHHRVRFAISAVLIVLFILR